MLCLTCKKISPSGSVFCAHCPDRRSFNGILCEGGHRCAVGTRTCPTCGRSDFSGHTYGLAVGWIGKLLTVATLILLWKFGLAHWDLVASILWLGASHGFGLLSNSDSGALERAIRSSIAYLFMGWIAGLFLSLLPGAPGKVGGFLRGLPVRVALFLLDACKRLLPALWRGAVQLSGLRPSKPGVGRDSTSGKGKS